MGGRKVFNKDTLLQGHIDRMHVEIKEGEEKTCSTCSKTLKNKCISYSKSYLGKNHIPNEEHLR